jgi:methyl-accepting chemotaxis protein
MKEAASSNEAVTTFSLPIYDAEGRAVGVLGADVSTVLLSDIIQRAKPTPHSYAMLMGQSQSFVVYPDSSKLLHQGLIPMLDEHADPTVKQALKLMGEGQTGHLRVRFDEGGYSYVFFKPFVRKPVPGRSDNDLNWSSAVVMSEGDIFGGFTRMCTIVILVAIAGLLVLWLFCRFIMNRQLRPLRMLTQSAQLISEGQYVETIAESRHVDEVGTLQNHFRQMQQALSTHIGELNRLTTALREDGDELERAYKQAKEAERMKTAVLHNMSSQMLRPANAISDGVEALSTRFSDMNQEEVENLANMIEQEGQEATQLLDQLLSASQEIPESH